MIPQERRTLSDFRMAPRTMFISSLAFIIGILGAIVSIALTKLIGLFTNLFFYHRLSFSFISPYPNHLGPFVIAVPVIGGLLIGLMARYGSAKIRGHGIPEAMEAILNGKSVLSPKVALLKPVSAAISIGSGGPFGAEGPIIMSGSALGSVIGQILHVTASERKVLLLCGAAAGMSATFHAPLASLFFAVELLAFEMRLRSTVPIAIASGVADYVRVSIIGGHAVFPSVSVPQVGVETMLLSIAFGLAGALLAYILTKAIYGMEDLFHRLPVHWMWWPAIGALFIGVGGYLVPQVLGVGYDTIGSLAAGHGTPNHALEFLLVKALIWIVALGSGTSGGILAPLLIIGGTAGDVLAGLFHAPDPAVWALLGMAAVFAGVTRSPLTSVAFLLELTHDLPMALPIMISCAVAAGLSAIILPRSILTEKIARRDRHIARDYEVDPLDLIPVGHVLSLQAAAAASTARISCAEREAGLAIAPVCTAREALNAMIYHGEESIEIRDPASGASLGAVSRGELLEAGRERMLEEFERERLIPLLRRKKGRTRPIVTVVSEELP